MNTSKGHLTYCTNIHSGETWHDHFLAIRKNFPLIKETVSPDNEMGIGLRLSNIASLELIKETELQEFKKWLKENDAYVFTINGFPFGGFHNTRVKDEVHTPDWTTRERVEYTIRLFDILAELLPESMDGGVSTSPLTYRYWFSTPGKLALAREKATKNLLEVTEHLINIRKTTGKILHVDIEPEPDGILETGNEFIEWFQKDLLVIGIKQIAEKFSISEDEAEEMIKTHVRLCYDICHFAIGYEAHKEIIDRLKKEDIKIGKIQISAALKAEMDNDPIHRSEVKKAFERFNEPTYLHQVVAATSNSQFLRYRDLPEALIDIENPLVNEWRAHFHIPIFEHDFGLLRSTQNEICEVLNIQRKLFLTPHLEVETYTWDVTPEALKLPLQKSISRELLWVINQLSDTNNVFNNE